MKIKVKDQLDSCSAESNYVPVEKTEKLPLSKSTSKSAIAVPSSLEVWMSLLRHLKVVKNKMHVLVP